MTGTKHKKLFKTCLIFKRRTKRIIVREASSYIYWPQKNSYQLTYKETINLLYLYDAIVEETLSNICPYFVNILPKIRSISDIRLSHEHDAWLEENCTDRFCYFNNKVAFKSENDATHFKLTWL